MYRENYDSYIAISRPALLIVLLDQSFSMNGPYAGTSTPKIEILAANVERLISDIITLCERGEEKPRHWFDVGVIGYTSSRTDPPQAIIGPVLAGEQGTLTGRDLVSVSDLFDDPLAIERREKQVDDGAGGSLLWAYNRAIWYAKPDPGAMGGSPMAAALGYTRRIAVDWCRSHPTSFPPVVIHLTDGDSFDGDPEPEADRLKAVETMDGPLLLFNVFFTDLPHDPTSFPIDDNELTDQRARMLFRMSSVIPRSIRTRLDSKGVASRDGSRGCIVNADPTSLLWIFPVGT